MKIYKLNNLDCEPKDWEISFLDPGMNDWYRTNLQIIFDGLDVVDLTDKFMEFEGFLNDKQKIIG